LIRSDLERIANCVFLDGSAAYAPLHAFVNLVCAIFLGVNGVMCDKYFNGQVNKSEAS